MNLSVGVDVDVRCTGCGVEVAFPTTKARRVLQSLEADAVYADVDDACASCSATRICVTVKFRDDHGDEYSNEADP